VEYSSEKSIFDAQILFRSCLFVGRSPPSALLMVLPFRHAGGLVWTMMSRPPTAMWMKRNHIA
jgi:hypothetical protein